MNNIKKEPGIYKITIKDKSYIGSSVRSLKDRYILHKSRLKNNIHPNKKLQQYYNKYGKTFEFVVLEYTKIDIRQKEGQYILNSYNLFNKNLPKKNYTERKAHTEETKKLLSIKQKERYAKQPPEFFKDLSERAKLYNTKPFLGKHHTEENKKILRQRHIDKNNGGIYCIETKETFKTQLDAAKTLGIKQGHISEVLSGKRHSVKGFTFKFVEKDAPVYVFNYVKIKDNKGNVFETIADAIKYHGFISPTVRSALNKRGSYTKNSITLVKYV